MSVARSPRLAAIRSKEDEADRKRVAVLVGAIAFLAAALVVLAITLKVFQ